MLNKPLYRRLPGVVPLIVFAAILCGEVSCRADTLPQPPCGSATFPPYPDLENSPVARVWDRAESGRDWAPPACTGWTDSGFTTLVVTVARFRHASGVEGLLRRIGAISGLAGIRMRIRSASPDRLVFDTENTGVVRCLRMTMFRPGGMQSITFLDRKSQGVWRYYSIMRTSRNASLLTVGYEASSINRAVAYYRYLAGIPTDKEPPAAP